jgi:hypothetical protein
MTDDPKRRQSSLAVWLVAAAVLLPIAYVLLTGPAVWLHSHGYLPESVFIVYWPLETLCNHVEPVRQAIALYLSFWR